MKRLFSIIAALLLALNLFVYAPVRAIASDGGLLNNAEEQDPAPDTPADIATSGVTLGISSARADDAVHAENTVFSTKEFENWLYDNIEAGGTVYLGCDVILESPVTIYEYEIEGSGHIIVDTNAYSLIYDGGVLDLPSFEITGEGVGAPVLDILDCGYDYFSYSDYHWNDVIHILHITATGKDGTGGIAVRVSGANTGAASSSWLGDTGSIRSYGEGAIGLYLDVQTDVYCLDIEVQGENSRAVFAAYDTTLYYCSLKADGAGAGAASGSGDVVFDTCKISPQPQNQSVIDRHIVEAVGKRFYSPIKQYDDAWYHGNPYYQNRTLVTFLLSGEDEAERHTLTTFIDWDEVKLSSIDTSELGKNKIPGILPASLQGFGLDEYFPIELTMEVRDARSLTVSEINFYEELESGGKYAAAYTWNGEDLEKNNLILWRSDDGGNIWYDFTHSSAVLWHNQYPPDDYDLSLFRFYYDGITAPVTLQLEELGVSESNLMLFYPFDGKTYGAYGGDRDGGDRIIMDDPYGDNPGVSGPAGLFPGNPGGGEDETDGGTDDGTESGNPDDGESDPDGGTNGEAESGEDNAGGTAAPKTGKPGRSAGRTSGNGNIIPTGTILEQENATELLIYTEPVELEQTVAITEPATPENTARSITDLSDVKFIETKAEPDINEFSADNQTASPAAEVKAATAPAGQPDKPPRQYDMGLTVLVAACAGAATVLTLRIKKLKA